MKLQIYLIGVVAALTGISISVYAQQSPLEVENRSDDIVGLPDWSKITFADLGPIEEAGSVPTKYDRDVGWKVSRTWEAGDRPADILKLGDLEESLSPQVFSLRDIFERVKALEEPTVETVETPPSSSEEESSVLPEGLTLGDYAPISNQTISTLVEANPEMGTQAAEDVAPVADLLRQHGVEDLSTDLATLATDTEIGELGLDELDLEQYDIDSIPNVSDVPIEDFEDFEDTSISDVPGLEDLPLGEFPSPIQSGNSIVGRVDVIYGDAETDRNNTITGSKIEGFNVSCKSKCAHLELDDLENEGRAISSVFEGDQWISGRDIENNWVRGGTGCLSGGKEPTGVHQFGDTAKSVLWTTDESNDTASLKLFFNIKTNCGDSAYFIGPIPHPLGSISINDKIYLGPGM